MDRKQKVLAAIVKHFIQTAEPVGSNTIIVSYNIKMSPATIRNDMAILEKQGLIYQPHTSAGRVPTSLGYRKFVNELADIKKAEAKAKEIVSKVFQEYRKEKVREKIYEAVAIISKSSGNVSFATLPDNNRTFYLGLANVLKQPEFSRDPIQASQVVEVLENNNNFLNLLNKLDLDERTQVFIGEENIIENIKSCSLIIKKYKIEEYEGYLGILGPTRMDYPFYTALVEEIGKLLSI